MYNIKLREKHEYIRVVTGIGDWYIVQIEGDYVGVVAKNTLNQYIQIPLIILVKGVVRQLQQHS